VTTVVVVEQVPGRADAIVQGIGDDVITCIAEDAREALRLAYDLLPNAIVVGTAPGDMPPTSLLRRLASDERLSGVQRIALAGGRQVDPAPEELVGAGAQLVLPAVDAAELGRRLVALRPSPAVGDVPTRR
jgi:hypothetical protein